MGQDTLFPRASLFDFLAGTVHNKGKRGNEKEIMQEYFDIVDDKGLPTGEIISREEAHAKGICHRTAHIWIIRKEKGTWQVLLQKRSKDKDSFPGMYDTSSAGHIQAGDEPLESAMRELKEELGVAGEAKDFSFAGQFHIHYSMVFHGKPFHDDEVVWVYVYTGPVKEEDLTLQESEVEEVRWFDLELVWEEIHKEQEVFCVTKEGLGLLRDYLKRQEEDQQHP